MKKKHLIFLIPLIILSAQTFAQTAQKDPLPQHTLPDTTTLLLSYVENDTELKNLAITAKKAALS